MEDQEPYGTTALPVPFVLDTTDPVTVWYDAEVNMARAEQAQSREMAKFAAIPNDDCINGRLIAVNNHHVAYVVKNGLIRILNRHSALRSLLRFHENQKVSDITFFGEGDILVTVGSKEGLSSLLCSRVFVHNSEIHVDPLLEISSPHFFISQIVWHPFDPNQFWMIHTDSENVTVATLIETTKITTTTGDEKNHVVCDFHSDYCIREGAIQLKDKNLPSLTDLAWNEANPRYVVSSHHGYICLWDLKDLQVSGNGDSMVVPKRVGNIYEESAAFSRVLWLPHSNAFYRDQVEGLTSCFVTASDQNSVLTFWSAFEPPSQEGGSPTPPRKIQTIRFEEPSPSYNVDVCYYSSTVQSLPSCFLLLSDRSEGKIFAFHVKAEWGERGESNPVLYGSDYVVPFITKSPIYSWKTATVPTTDITDEELNEQGGLVFDMKLFSYQSHAVQCNTLTSYMCLPPENSWTEKTIGVRYEIAYGQQPMEVVDYNEVYEVEEEDDEGEEEIEAPDPSSLPLPTGLASPATGSAGNPLATNPFANWLGAMAAKSSDPVPLPPVKVLPPPTPTQSISEPPTPVGSFLSPSDILAGRGLPSHPPRPSTSRAETPIQTNKEVARGRLARENEETASSMTIDLAAQVRAIVREEMETFLLPTIEEIISRGASSSTMTDAALSSMSSSVSTTLNASFAGALKSILIPSLESINSQVLAKVSAKIDQASIERNPEIAALSAQVKELSETVSQLSTEVKKSLMANGVGSPPNSASSKSSAKNPNSRDRIEKLLKQGQYENAFKEAFSAEDPDMTVYCCSKANLNVVLGGSKPQLSQPIVLCVLQQLGTTVTTADESNLRVALDWLQECAYTLDATDDRIKQHVPAVLRQVLSSIDARMKRGEETMRRPLQRLLQIIRGMQLN